MKKRVLLIGPTYMDLYKDIIEGLRKLEYDVNFAPELSSKKDPYNVRRLWFNFSFGYEKVKEKYWSNLLNQKAYSNDYDILFVINGQGLHSYLFKALKDRNPNIKCYNFLFDTIKGVYKFNLFFQYFDKVYSFDRSESKEYGLIWLPIYWVPLNKVVTESYDIFGFGSYIPSRFIVYKELYNFARRNSLRSFIKIQYVIHREWLYSLVRVIGRPLGFILTLSLDDYHSPLIAKEKITPNQFRKIMSMSKIVIDTPPEHQDGMTARFMWAIGIGKRIITTNSSIVDYKFFSPNQIFVLEGPLNKTKEKDLLSFIAYNKNSDDNIAKEIEKYRIDNWIKTIIE